MSKLTPIDIKRCQAEVPNGNSFMTLGGVPGHIRCTNVPTVIASENQPAEDGLMGSMSLCNSCLAKMKEQLGEDYATISTLKEAEASQS
jgi:hypothetical protein